MKYRSINLLLPVLVVSSSIGAADKASSPTYKGVTAEALQKKVLAQRNQKFDETPLPTWNELREQREQKWEAHDKAVAAMHEKSMNKTARKPATAKPSIATLKLQTKRVREKIDNLPISKPNRVELISDDGTTTPAQLDLDSITIRFDGMTIPALTELASQWEPAEEDEQVFVMFGSEQNEDVLMQKRPMTAYRVKEVPSSEGYHYQPVSAETFKPGETKSKPAQQHLIKSAASKPLHNSKVVHKNTTAPPTPPKTCTQLFDNLKQIDEKLTTAVSATLIGDEDLDNRKKIIEQLRPELHKKVAALRFQHYGLAQAREELNNVSNMLAAQKTPDDFTFYAHTLVEWYKGQMTDEEKKQEISDEQIIRNVFTDEELALAEKTITTKDTFKQSKIVHASNRGQECESTVELDGNGTIPLERAVEVAQKTYDSWYTTAWGMPQDASDLLKVAGELAQSRQQFAATTDANERKKLTLQQKEWKNKQSELIKGIKAKMLTSIKENLPDYSPALTEQKNNLQALIKSEDEATVKNRGLVASILLKLPSEEREQLFAIDKKMASITQKRVDEIYDLLTNPEHYVIEEPKKEDVKLAEPKGKEEESSADKSAKPKRSRTRKRK